MGSLSFLQQIFLTQEPNQGLLHCRWILYQLSSQGSPYYRKKEICEIIKTLRMNEILEEMCLGLGKRKAVARR